MDVSGKLRYIVVITGVAVIAAASAQEQVPCDAQYPPEGDSFVCRCNATYCDTFPPLDLPDYGAALWVESSMAAARFQRSEVVFLPDDGSLPDYELTDIPGQRILGFGGAITDSAALNILQMSEETQDNILKSYYSSEGLEYNMNRINIGGCDFSVRGYTYADTEGDELLDLFQLQTEDIDAKIPLIKRAANMATSPLLNIGAAWSAPAWMKSNNNLTGFGHLLPSYYQLWAEYHIKFLDAYASNNVTIWGMSTQNEPLDGNLPQFPFNCMGWTAETQRQFIAENLGPLLHERGYKELHLMIMDDQRINLPQWPREVFNDSAADAYCDGIAVHWYVDQASTDRLDATHELFPNKFILNTESCNGDIPFSPAVVLGSWERHEKYAIDIIEDLEHWVVGWVDWNIALDQQGGPNWCQNYVDSPIIINHNRDEFYKNPMFYTMGHFSKFLRPGAEHLQMKRNLEEEPFRVTAFRNPDESVAIVILNLEDEARDISVLVPERGLLLASVSPRSINSIIFK